MGVYGIVWVGILCGRVFIYFLQASFYQTVEHQQLMGMGISRSEVLGVHFTTEEAYQKQGCLMTGNKQAKYHTCLGQKSDAMQATYLR